MDQVKKTAILKSSEENTRQDALQIFNAAVDSVKPYILMKQHLYADDKSVHIGNEVIDLSDIKRLIVIAAGKAAAAMAVQAEQQMDELITAGICVTKYGHGLLLKKITLIEAGHPIPDENSLQAGAEISLLLKDVTDKDVVLVLLSGGASALMEDLPKGITLHDVQQVIQALIHSGAGIHEINCVRKHLSNIKGGGLAGAAFPARVYTLILSDVVGDNLDVIASGPTVPDTSTFDDAMIVLTKYHLLKKIPANIRRHLRKGIIKELNETSKAGNIIFKKCFTTIIGSNKISLHAAATEAKNLGYHTLIYKENISDNTEQFARSMIRRFYDYNGVLPACILSGGETTLEVKGTGKGGRNQHFVLCALDEMLHCCGNTYNNMTILSAGTDGTDGPTDATGAIVDTQTFINKPGIQQDIQKSLAEFDSYHFFEEYGALIKTGPTQTNVMDIMLLVISAR